MSVILIIVNDVIKFIILSDLDCGESAGILII